jgi:hypothetical protein
VSTRVTAKSCRAARLTASSGEGNRTSADLCLAWGYAQRTGHVQDDQRLHLASVFDASQRDSRFSWWWRPNSVCCLRRMRDIRVTTVRESVPQPYRMFAVTHQMRKSP